MTTLPHADLQLEASSTIDVMPGGERAVFVIARASAAWRAQTSPKIPGDDQEFISLPEPRR
jgi:hypothetical protein